MPIKVGNDEFAYEIVEGWGMSNDSGVDGTFDVAGVGVDSRGNVYLFNRGPHPVVVLDDEGNFLRRWGDKKTFPNAHAVTIGPDDSVWLTDTFDHTVRKCAPDGKILMTLGVSGKPSRGMSGEPFCRCTHAAIHPGTGEIFVSDGYGNARVHKYSPDGRLLYSWGEPGNRPGQFNLPHNICTDRDGCVYVADRENQRVQAFTPNGRLEHVWTGMARPCGMYIDTAGSQLCYIGELSSAWWCQGARDLWEICNQPGCGPRLSIYSLDGELRATLLDNGQGEEPSQMIAPHGVAVNRNGDIYIGEVSATAGPWFPRKDKSKPFRTVLKLARKTRPDTFGQEQYAR
ncbi:MAG TPA: peptidyl-alpha-hydroxyglycine alpha-amidating lyase family protein [Candidatus Binataceae bacterium]|nr:peptidyl-alpha-hydroxyglycine alpha-amidating lyase family protein [Candidatus Binataceae bacterium]